MWKLRCIAKAARRRHSRSALQLRGCNVPASYKFNISSTSFGFGDPHFLSGTDILVIGEHLRAFLSYPRFVASDLHQI